MNGWNLLQGNGYFYILGRMCISQNLKKKKKNGAKM